MDNQDHYQILLENARKEIEIYNRGLQAVLEKKRVRDEKHAKFLRIINKQVKKWNTGKEKAETRIKEIEALMASERKTGEKPVMSQEKKFPIYSPAKPEILSLPVMPESDVKVPFDVVDNSAQEAVSVKNEATGEEVSLTEEELRQLEDLAKED
jgi:hypothetical protein